MQVRFGGFTLDFSTRELRRGDEVLHLSPKGFQLLAILIEQRPKAMAKTELQQTLWPSTFVAETNLANLVGEVRAVLNEDSRKPKFIRTVYGFGYAFSGEALNVTETAAKAPAPLPNPPPRRLGSLSLLSIFVLSAALSMKSSHTPARHYGGIESIAILPFKVFSPIPSDQYFGIGISDVITTRLSNVRHMSVRPTSAVALYGAKGQDPVTAGAQLRVDSVLDGTVRRAGNRIRVSVQLFAVRGGRPLWGKTFDENATEAFKVEDSIAESVANALALKLTDEESRLLTRRHTEDSEAYRLYLIGRYHLTKTSGTGWKESIPYFEAALREDPSYALAYAGLSHAYAKQGIFNDATPALLWDRAAANAGKALELDDDLSEAHAALAIVRMVREWKWDAAEQGFRRAIELNPSDPLAHRYYAMLLQAQGRFPEAIAQRQMAQELDPLSVAVNRELGLTYYFARQYGNSIRQQRLVLELDPNFVQSLIGTGQVLVAQNRVPEAIVQYRKAFAIDPMHVGAQIWLARAEALAGRPEEARRLLSALERQSRDKYVSPYQLAIVYNALGETDKACELLELAASQRSSNGLNLAVEPALDGLRSHPRYLALVRHLGLN